MKAYHCLIAAVILSAFVVYAQSNGPTPRPRESSDSQKENSTNSNKYSHYQQRGTQELPFVVKTPSPTTKEEADYERYQRETKPTYEWWSVLITGFIAFITAVLAVFNVFLWLSTRKAANAAHRSADAVIRIESPIIRVFDPPVISSGSRTSTEGVSSQFLTVKGFKFVNYGRTPAFPQRLDTGWQVVDKLPVTPVYANPTTVASDPIISEKTYDGMSWFTDFVEPTAEQWADIDRGIPLWYYGCLYYRNFMNDMQESRFCWRLFKLSVPQGFLYSFVSDDDTPEAYTKST